ncbi:MAG: hypothetical protein PCFJNLEI_02915 [Verrucomicrobiae bacterium]|nr:hypothetical protein [Verrucomicrobiae bacterium]
MFFVGLQVPLQRLVRLWGKPFAERQAIAWPAGRALTQAADQLPLTARVYLVDPQGLPWWVYTQAHYYFFPRKVSMSMTDHYYGTDAELAKWNEHPTEAYLATNGFTHIMSFKNGIQLRPVAPLSQFLNATP